MTQRADFHILPGHLDDLVKALRDSPSFVFDGDYFHAATPPNGTPLVHGRLHPQVTGLHGEALSGPSKPTDYVPVVSVFGDKFSVLHTDIVALVEYRAKALEIAEPHLAKPYGYQAADRASATEARP